MIVQPRRFEIPVVEQPDYTNRKKLMIFIRDIVFQIYGNLKDLGLLSKPMKVSCQLMEELEDGGIVIRDMSVRVTIISSCSNSFKAIGSLQTSQNTYQIDFKRLYYQESEEED